MPWPDTAEPTDDELPISVADLSSQAFDRLLDAIRRSDPSTDVELADAIAQMAADLGIGDRNTAITLIDEPDKGHPKHKPATIDAAVRERMQRLSTQPLAAQDQALVGVLVEADFAACQRHSRSAASAGTV